MIRLFRLLMFGANQDGPARTASERRRFLGVEQMEQRTLLATDPIRIGSLGDSLTDEYQFYAPDRTAAQNWVEILSARRPSQVSFGAFSTTTRGETRNQGYAQDWARSGATAVGPDVSGAGTTLINQYNGGDPAGAPGLLTQPGGLSNIDVATILIGGNQYESTLAQVLTNIVSQSSGQQTIGQFIEDQLSTAFGTTIPDDILTGVQDAITAIRAQNPTFPIVLISPPDVGVTPLVQGAVAAINTLAPGYGNLLELALGSTAMTVDTDLANLAKNTPDVQFVNLDDVIQNFLANPVIDGTYIDPTAAGPSYTDLFVGDGFHPGTVGQALLANAIAAKIDAFFPGAIQLLNNREILAYAEAVQPVTKLELTASAGSTSPGVPITFTVQVFSFPDISSTTTEENFSTVPPTGTVSFFDLAQGNKLLGITNLKPVPTGNSMNPTYKESVATFTTSSLSTGVHEIVAIYNGNTVYPAASTASALEYVGTRQQAQLFSFVTLFQSQLGVQISEPQLDQWNKQLDRGVPPQHVARAVIRYVYLHTKFPRPQAAALLARARQLKRIHGGG